MLEKDGQYVEPLIDLTVRINQVAVVHGKHVVDADVDVDAGEAVLVLEQRHLDCGNVAQCSFLSNLFDDFTAMFDQLMLIIGHPAMKHNDDIYIAATGRPESIHARSRGRYRNFTLQKIALRPAVTVIE